MTTIHPSKERRSLGRSDIQVSPIAWGMWRFSSDELSEAQERVEAALDAGITLFDTADIYGADTPAGFGCAEGRSPPAPRDGNRYERRDSPGHSVQL